MLAAAVGCNLQDDSANVAKNGDSSASGTLRNHFLCSSAHCPGCLVAPGVGFRVGWLVSINRHQKKRGTNHWRLCPLLISQQPENSPVRIRGGKTPRRPLWVLLWFAPTQIELPASVAQTRSRRERVARLAEAATARKGDGVTMKSSEACEAPSQSHGTEVSLACHTSPPEARMLGERDA